MILDNHRLVILVIVLGVFPFKMLSMERVGQDRTSLSAALKTSQLFVQAHPLWTLSACASLSVAGIYAGKRLYNLRQTVNNSNRSRLPGADDGAQVTRQDAQSNIPVDSADALSTLSQANARTPDSPNGRRSPASVIVQSTRRCPRRLSGQLAIINESHEGMPAGSAAVSLAELAPGATESSAANSSSQQVGPRSTEGAVRAGAARPHPPTIGRRQSRHDLGLLNTPRD